MWGLISLSVGEQQIGLWKVFEIRGMSLLQWVVISPKKQVEGILVLEVREDEVLDDDETMKGV